MKLIFAIAVLSSLGLSMPAVAENLEHLSQLLATNQCPQCDLSGSGLVLSNLSGAQLSGTNLVGANLSQANLSGADLSGANLSGASLNGANLTGANLTGAILVGADLRGAYLTNANFTAANLDSAYVQGAIDIPSAAGTPESFYGWGLNETQKGNYKGAIEHYNQAISLNPKFAPAYLAKGYALLRLGNEAGASQNGEIAAKLFEEQKNDNGYETSQSFVKNIKALQEARTQERGNAQFDSIVRGVGSILLRFLLNGL